VPVTGRAARAALLMALAARKSYDENQPVALDEVDVQTTGNNNGNVVA